MMDQQTPQSVAITSLPSIKELFVQTWETLKKKLLHIFIFYIISMVATIVLGALFGLIIVGSNTAFLVELVSAIGKATPPSFSPELFQKINFPAFFLGGGLFLIAMILVGSVVEIGMTLLIGSTEEKISYKEIISKSIGKIIPLFVTGLLTSLLVFGGFFVFFIPALLFSLLFAFVRYEVIFDTKEGVGAIRSSVSMVLQHFGEIFARIAVLVVLYIVVAFLPQILSEIAPRLEGLFGFVSFFLNIFLGWFAMVYAIVLYKQVKAVSNPEHQSSLLWIVIVALIGWILFIVSLFFVVNLASTLGKQFIQGNKSYPAFDQDYKYNQKFMVPGDNEYRYEESVPQNPTTY